MRALRRVAFVTTCVLLCGAASAIDLAKVVEFHIVPQRLSTALLEFSHQANVQIVVGPEVGDRRSVGLSGQHSIGEALTTLLDGTALIYRVVNDTSITVGYGERSQNGNRSESPALNVPNAASGAPSSGDAARTRPPADDVTTDRGSSGSALQEIVVTATRREQNLSKVPISITAFTQGSMDNLGIKDIAGMVRFTPGLSIIDQGNLVSIAIRGIGSSAGASTTGIYIDETPIQERALSEASQALPKTFDLDRVEVLRGPQGTLFGAGSEGGTIRYILKQPSLTTYSSYARSEVSFTERGAPSYEAGVAAGGPVIDGTLGVRASLWYRRDGGWIDLVNPYTQAPVQENNNYGESTAARFAATWAPTSAISITPSIVFQDRKLHDLPTYWGVLSDPSSNQPVSGEPTRSPEDDSYGLGSLKVTADLGSAQFISNTSGFWREDNNGYDATLYDFGYYQTLGWPPKGFPFQGSACPTHASCYPLVDGSGLHVPPSLQNYQARGLLTQKQDAFTQEFRLQSRSDTAIAWTVGAFYSIQRTSSSEQIADPQVDRFFEGVFGTTMCSAFGQPCNANGSTYLPHGDRSYINDLTSHDRQLAGFGEVVWPLADRLKLTTGARLSKLDFNSTSLGNGPTNGGPSYASGQENGHPITERASLAFQADASNLYYATYSTGFRPGGANAPIPKDVCAVDFKAFGISGAPASYSSDTVKSYEAGAKNNIGNRFKLASSIYYIKWNSIEQQVVLPTCQFLYTANLGTAVSKGADLDLQWAVTDSIIMDAAIGYTSATYSKSVYPGPGAMTPIVNKGDAIVSGLGPFSQPVSPWTVAVGAQYNFNTFAHQSFARLDYEFASKNNTLFAGDDPRTVQYDPYLGPTSARTFVSARAGTAFGDLSVELFIDNLLDSRTITSITHTTLDGSGPQPPVSPLYTDTAFRPRTFGLNFIYRH
jgi:iron complex outermembrane receptor protein